MSCLHKNNVNFKFQQPSLFFFGAKLILLKVVHPQKIYQQTEFRGPTSTGESFASTSVVWKSAILEWFKLRD